MQLLLPICVVSIDLLHRLGLAFSLVSHCAEMQSGVTHLDHRGGEARNAVLQLPSHVLCNLLALNFFCYCSLDRKNKLVLLFSQAMCLDYQTSLCDIRWNLEDCSLFFHVFFGGGLRRKEIAEHVICLTISFKTCSADLYYSQICGMAVASSRTDRYLDPAHHGVYKETNLLTWAVADLF